MNSKNRIKNFIESGKLERYQLIGTVALVVSLIGVIITNVNNSTYSQRAERVEILKIQYDLGKSYDQWRDDIDSLNIDLKYGRYEEYDKDKKSKLNEYWEKICQSEFLVFNDYGEGIGSSCWAFYDTVISHAIRHRPILQMSLKEYLDSARNNSSNYYKIEYIEFLEKRYKKVTEEKGYYASKDRK